MKMLAMCLGGFSALMNLGMALAGYSQLSRVQELGNTFGNMLGSDGAKMMGQAMQQAQALGGGPSMGTVQFLLVVLGLAGILAAYGAYEIFRKWDTHMLNLAWQSLFASVGCSVVSFVLGVAYGDPSVFTLFMAVPALAAGMLTQKEQKKFA